MSLENKLLVTSALRYVKAIDVGWIGVRCAKSYRAGRSCRDRIRDIRIGPQFSNGRAYEFSTVVSYSYSHSFCH
jgi:hypothetical protein